MRIGVIAYLVTSLGDFSDNFRVLLHFFTNDKEYTAMTMTLKDVHDFAGYDGIRAIIECELNGFFVVNVALSVDEHAA